MLANGTNGGLAANYSLPTPTGLTANITPKGLSVVADAKSKRTGSADPSFTFVATGFAGTESAATALSGALTRDPGETAGTYTIRQGFAGGAQQQLRYQFHDQHADDPRCSGTSVQTTSQRWRSSTLAIDQFDGDL